MPDLQPVFEELRRRMSLHEDVFRRSINSTDANGSGARKVDEPAPETSYLLLGAANVKYPDGVMFGAVNIGKRYVSYHLMSGLHGSRSARGDVAAPAPKDAGQVLLQLHQGR
jgi:hypothetical protein